LAKDEQGKAYALNDPQAESLMAIGANQASEPQACVHTLLAREDLWGNELAASEAWLARVSYWHDQVLHQGVDATVKYIIQQDFS
jgi:fructuronate reductase